MDLYRNTPHTMGTVGTHLSKYFFSSVSAHESSKSSGQPLEVSYEVMQLVEANGVQDVFSMACKRGRYSHPMIQKKLSPHEHSRNSYFQKENKKENRRNKM